MQHRKRHSIPLPRLTCFAAFHGQAFTQPVLCGDGTQHLRLRLRHMNRKRTTRVIGILVAQHQ